MIQNDTWEEKDLFLRAYYYHQSLALVWFCKALLSGADNILKILGLGIYPSSIISYLLSGINRSVNFSVD